MLVKCLRDRLYESRNVSLIVKQGGWDQYVVIKYLNPDFFYLDSLSCSVKLITSDSLLQLFKAEKDRDDAAIIMVTKDEQKHEGKSTQVSVVLVINYLVCYLSWKHRECNVFPESGNHWSCVIVCVYILCSCSWMFFLYYINNLVYCATV